MAEHSFDVISKVDLQEVSNAIQQAMKEIGQRFDFRGSKSNIELDKGENKINIVSDDEYKLKNVIDILQSKLINEYLDGAAVRVDGRQQQPAVADEFLQRRLTLVDCRERLDAGLDHDLQAHRLVDHRPARR